MNSPSQPSSGVPLLEIRGLHAGYLGAEVLRGIDLLVQPGEIVSLLGANGAGKTTTLMAICGLVRSRAGQILFAGQRIDGLSPEEIVRRGISQAPEGRHIFPRLSVRENLELGAYTRAGTNGLERAFTLFPILHERQNQPGGTLSGGEQQMLAIARALMAQPKMLLLDEPSLGLAPLMVERIFAIIREINAAGTTILLVEQNANMALRIAHRGYVLQTGQIVLQDRAADLLSNPQIQKSYLGG